MDENTVEYPVNPEFLAKLSSSKTQAKVVAPFSATLNQTNIGHNNNKFYKIQLLDEPYSYSVGTHWGRVGETG